MFLIPFACVVNSQGGATPMQAKWIKLDLVPTRCESDNAQYGPSNYSKINELIVRVLLYYIHHL